jgi:hypothetical protein
MSVSRSARIEILACIALAGCMKIYPDPELPDIDVEWYEGDCTNEGDNIRLALSGVDDPTLQREVTAACADMKTTFVDVPRQRYKLAASLLDAMGDEYSRSPPLDIDLRDGIDETTYIYFGGFNNFYVSWQLEGGVTCGSIGASFVSARVVDQDGNVVASAGAECFSMTMFGSSPAGTFDVDVAAFSDDGSTVATAPRIEDVAITFEMSADLGTVTLTPCGEACP